MYNIDTYLTENKLIDVSPLHNMRYYNKLIKGNTKTTLVILEILILPNEYLIGVSCKKDTEVEDTKEFNYIEDPFLNSKDLPIEISTTIFEMLL